MTVHVLPPSEQLNFGPLRQQMSQAFNLDDLRTLCFDLGIEYEDLAGETKQAKIISLIEYTQRHNRLPHLLETLAKVRPATNWQMPTKLTVNDLGVRGKVLKNVQATWIDGFLKNSLHSEVLKMVFTKQPNAVSRTWGIVL